MLEKLKELALRQEELEAQLSDPTVYADTGRLREIQRELKELGPVVEAWRAWKEARSRQSEAEALLHDPEMKALAQEELSEARRDLERLENELKILLLPRDPNDERRGRGGGCHLCRRPSANVYHVCPAPGLADGSGQLKPDGAGRRSGVRGAD